MPVNFPKPIVVTRSAPGDYIDGVWTAGEWDEAHEVFTPADEPTYEVTINGNVQDPSNRDVQAVEMICRSAGRSAVGAVILRCNEQVYPDNEATGQSADRFTDNGYTYEVLKVTPRNTLADVAHWRAVCPLVSSNTESAAL